MHKIKVDISGKFPVFIRADAEAFGSVFADMADEEQIHVFRAIFEAMKAWPTQWDHISIALEKPENHDVRDTLREVLFPTEATNNFTAGFIEAARLIDLDAITAEREKLTLTPGYLKALAGTFRLRA